MEPIRLRFPEFLSENDTNSPRVLILQPTCTTSITPPRVNAGAAFEHDSRAQRNKTLRSERRTTVRKRVQYISVVPGAADRAPWRRRVQNKFYQRGVPAVRAVKSVIACRMGHGDPPIPSVSLHYTLPISLIIY